MAEINLGDNYRFEENPDGELVIRDVTSGSIIAQHKRGVDLWSVTGLRTSDFNADTHVPDATHSEIQSVISTASSGEVIQSFGDLSLIAPLHVEARIHWIHHGDISVEAAASDGIRIGHSAQFQNFSVIVLGNIRGQGPADGASAFDVRSANAGFISCGRIAHIQQGFRFEGRPGRTGPLDNTVLAHKVEAVRKGIELYANVHIVQGMVFRNFPIFDAETAVHVHTATRETDDRATLNYFDGITVHGSTNPTRNVHEILEEGNHATAHGSLEGNFYGLKFLPGDSSLTTLYEPSRLYAPNRQSLPLGGVVGDTVYAFPEWFPTPQDAIDHAESVGYRRVLVPPGSHNGIRISSPLEVSGLGVSTGGGPDVATIFDGGTSRPGIEVRSNDVKLENLQAKTMPGGGRDLDAINTGDSIAVRVVDCTVSGAAGDGVFVNGDWVILRGILVKGPTGGEDIHLGPHSARCVVDGNVASVVDNGTRTNLVGDNTS